MNKQEDIALAAELLEDLDRHWQFDNGQVHTHTWHTKQDFLEKWRKRLSPESVIEGER